MNSEIAKGILETEGINAARAFLGYPPLPDEVIKEAEKNSEFVRYLRDDALRGVNDAFARHGVVFS